MRKFTLACLILSTNVLAGVCEGDWNYKVLQSLKQVKQLVTKCKAKTLSDFLQTLPEEMRIRYTLLYKSKGIGHSSPQHPRIMLSGHGSDISFAFSSLPNQKTQTLEIIDYNPEKKDFDLFTIDFDSKGGVPPKVSAINPRQCMNCHHNKHMNKNQFFWNSKPNWPGVYGSLYDNHVYSEQSKDPLWDRSYYHSEGLAFELFVKPKLGRQGLFKHLPEQIFHPVWKNGFRGGARLFIDPFLIQNHIYANSLKLHLEKNKISDTKVKYYTLAATLCMPLAFEKGSQGHDYTVEDTKKWIRKFMSPQAIIIASKSVAQSMEIETVDFDSVIEQLFTHVKKKVFTTFNRAKNETCQGLNLLSKEVNSNKINCDQMYLPQMVTDFTGETAKMYNNVDVEWSHFHTPHLVVHDFLFRAIGFPFNRWTLNGDDYHSFMTGFVTNVNMSAALFKEFDFSDIVPSSYIAKHTELNPKYVFLGEQADFSYAGVMGFRANYCSKLVERSKRSTLR